MLDELLTLWFVEGNNKQYNLHWTTGRYEV